MATSNLLMFQTSNTCETSIDFAITSFFLMTKVYAISRCYSSSKSNNCFFLFRQKDAQWAYLCVVTIILLMLFAIKVMRGFHSQYNNKREITIHDTNHMLTVKGE